MTLQELYQELQGSFIDSDVAITYHTAGGAYWMLLFEAGVDKFMICQAQMIQKDSYIEITGNGKFATMSNIGDTVFSFWTSVNEYGVVVYKLTLSVKGEGTFREFFGSLPSSLVFVGSQENKECIYADFVIRYPVITIDSGTVFERFPFHLTGFIRPVKNHIWESYARLLAGSLPVEGMFAFQKKGFENIGAIISLSAALTETLMLPVGHAALKLKLVSMEQERVFGRERYISKAYLSFQVTVENLSENMELYTELFTGNFYLTMGANFPKGLSIGNIVNFFASFFQVEQEKLLLPEDTVLTAFGLKGLQMNFTQKNHNLADGLSLEHIRVTCGLSEPWNLPVPYVTLGELMAAWEVSWFGRKSPVVSLYAATELRIELGSLKFILAVSGYIPQMRFYGELEITEKKQPDLQDMMEAFDAKAPAEWNAEEKLLASANIVISVPERQFLIDAYLNDVLSITVGNERISLEEIAVRVEIGPSERTFHIEGTIGFGGDEENKSDYFAFLLGADYREGWLFQGGLKKGEVNIGKLLENMFGIENILEDFFQIVLDGLEVEYSTRTGGFSLMASFYTSWFTVLGVTPKLGGRILLKKEQGEQDSLYGAALAYLDIEIFRILVQMDDFYSVRPSYVFRLEFQKLYLQATYEENREKDEILTITMGGVTLGGLVEELVHLLNGNAKFSLPAPWNLLNKIELSRFSLVLNTTKKTAAFLYQVDLSIPGLMEVRQVGLKYSRKSGKGGIDFVLTGRLLTTEYTQDTPLCWDVLDERPPQNTATSGTKLEVYYVGLGQHLDTGEVISSDSITEALSQLKKQITGGEAGGLPDVRYCEEINWLFGVDFKISDMFRFGMVLNDPVLYGAVIQVEASLKSPLAAFNGLFFELLYKKISDDVGMFRITFMMPERFRRIQLGIMTFTIGQILVEIYTNGSFLVDLGFPHQDDFSKSFGLEFSIFTGKGGIYFGILKQDAAKSVPKITNGAFSPVILVGIGLRVGLGRSFDMGIVKAGLSLELMGIFEGVLGFFKPDEKSQKETPSVEEAVYYRVRAKAGVLGTLFLTADLKIISLSVSAEIAAWCELVLESYKKARVELALSLKLSAKIKILFFKIQFSFHFHQNVEFTFGEDKKTPWVLMDGTQARKKRLFARRKLFSNVLTQEMFPTDKIGDWSIQVKIAPLFSVTTPLFQQKGMQTPEYCIAFLGVIQSSQFLTVLDMMTRWTLAAWKGDIVWREDILVLDSKVEQQVGYDAICRFFQNNVRIQMELATAIPPAENDVLEEGGMFPMLPQLVLKMGEEETDYGQNPVDEAYIQALNEYFAGLQPEPDRYEGKKVNRLLEGKVALCGVILTDWVQMILSEILRRIKNFFTSFSIQGMDIRAAAKAYDISVQDILTANPSLLLQVHNLPEYTYILREGDTLYSLTQKFYTAADQLWPMVSDQAGILRQGAVFTTENNQFDNSQAAMTVEEAAAYFFVRYHEYEMDEIYVRYANLILETNPELSGQWECITIHEQEINLPGKGLWIALPGDTVNRLAKFLLLLEEGTVYEKELWKEFRREFIEKNGGTEAAILPSYRIEAVSVIDGDLTLRSLFRRIYCDSFFLQQGEESSLKDTRLWNQNILSPMSAVKLQQVNLEAENTVGEILEKGICSLEELAGAVSSGGAGMKQEQQFLIVSAGQMKQQELLNLLVTKESASEILSMVSRFFLQGLRIPAPADRRADGFAGNSETVPLYQLLGQQKVLKATDQDLVLALWKKDEECLWLQVDQQEKILDAQTIQQALPSGCLTLLTKPKRRRDFTKSAKCWSLSQLLELEEYTKEGILYHSIGLLPEDLRGYLETCLKKPVLKVNQTETEEFLWGSLVDIEIQKGSEEGVYYIYGADAVKRQILRQIMDSPVSSLRVIYRPSELESDAQSYIADVFSGESMLVKTNLSRETHMGPRYLAQNQEHLYSACLNEPNRFLRLLWECSAVGGGYYLELVGAKLPDGIWDENNRGVLYIMVLYAGGETAKQGVNCVVIQKMAQEAAFYSRELLVDVPLLPPGYVGMELEIENREGEDTPQGRMDDLYQIAGYRITGGEVAASGDSVPVVPLEAEDGQADYYPIAIPLYRFAGDGSSFYGAVGKQAEIAIEIRDILGNRGEFHRQTITGTYNDMVIGMNQIPATSLCFTVKKGRTGPQLIIQASYITLKEVSQESVALLKLMQQQLACENMSILVSCSFQKKEWEMERDSYNDLQRYLRELYDYLAEDGRTAAGPEVFTLHMDLQKEEIPLEIVPLSVQMRIQRTGSFLAEKQVAGAEYSVSEISPYLGADDMEKEQFILDFESTLENLRIAQGDGGWYCVPVGTGFLQEVLVRPYTCPQEGKTIQSPEYYSYMPLATQLISRKVTVPGREGEEEEYSYREIDLDIWMKRFLTEVEEVFFSDYNACRAAKLCPDILDEMVGTKEALAVKLSSRIQTLREDPWVSSVLSDEEESIDAYVQTTAADRMKRNLKEAYDVTAIAVYDARFTTSSYCRMEMDICCGSGETVSPSKLSSAEKAVCLFLDTNYQKRAYPIDLTVSLSNLEYQIQKEQDGYESSEWLKLVHPVCSADPFASLDFHSDIKVPNPLKECPMAPSILSHQSKEADFLRWSYQAICQCRCYEQDSIYIKIRFSRQRMLLRANGRDLFQVLAEYDVQREGLLADLEKDDSTFINAYQEMKGLAASAVQVFPEGTQARDASGFHASEDIILLRVEFILDKELQFQVEPVEGSRELLQELGAGLGEISLLSGGEAGELLQFSIEITNLPVYRCQRAKPSIWLVQNENLFEDSWEKVREGFIYRTEEVSFGELRVFQNYTTCYMGKAGETKTVGEVITAFWEYMEFDYTLITADLAVWYLYRLREDETVGIRLPVTFIPNAVSSNVSKETAIVSTTENIEQWYTENRIEAGQGYLQFEVTVYSQTDGRTLLTAIVETSPMEEITS